MNFHMNSLAEYAKKTVLHLIDWWYSAGVHRASFLVTLTDLTGFVLCASDSLEFSSKQSYNNIKSIVIQFILNIG